MHTGSRVGCHPLWSIFNIVILSFEWNKALEIEPEILIYDRYDTLYLLWKYIYFDLVYASEMSEYHIIQDL